MSGGGRCHKARGNGPNSDLHKGCLLFSTQFTAVSALSLVILEHHQVIIYPHYLYQKLDLRGKLVIRSYFLLGRFVVTSYYSFNPRCELFLALIYECASESGYKVRRSLPLNKPLPLSATELVYIELQSQTYLGVCVGEGLDDHYYLVNLEPITVSHCSRAMYSMTHTVKALRGK